MRTLDRLWDPVTGVTPKPSQIVQDITRLKENFLLIVESHGDIVDGVAERNGYRRGVGPGKSYHARLPPKPASTVEELNLHPDAQIALRIIDAQERAVWERAQAQNNQSN